jgi:hypothetical protein
MVEPKKTTHRVRLEAETVLLDTSWHGNRITREGWVGTKHGVVLAYVALASSKDGPCTVLRYTRDGVTHRWEYARAYSDRTVGRMAAALARTVRLTGETSNVTKEASATVYPEAHLIHATVHLARQ